MDEYSSVPVCNKCFVQNQSFLFVILFIKMEPNIGIEPSCSAWKTDVLPTELQPQINIK